MPVQYSTKIATFICILLLSIYMFGSNLNSKFSVIDDHHIVSLVGSDGAFLVDDVVPYLKNEKDFDIGNYGRFRPSLQAARAIEMFFFGDKAFYYQCVRLLSFVLLMYFISIFIIEQVGAIYGGLIALILISEPAWRDIFTRIITSEAYTIFGLVVLIPVLRKMLNVINSGNKCNTSLWLFLLPILYLMSGGLVIGSKENFLFFIFVPVVMLLASSKSASTGLFNKYVNFVSIVLVVYGLTIAGVILSYFLLTAEDISGYGFQSSTVIKIMQSFFNVFFIEWGGLLLSVFLLFLLYKTYKEKSMHNISIVKREIAKLSTYLSILLLILLFQVIFYTGNLPSGTRYDFPTIVLYSFYLVLCITFLKNVLQTIVKNKKYVKLMILTPILLIFMEKNPVQGIIKTSNASYYHQQRTKDFQSTLSNILKITQENADHPILVNSYNVWDYELISSFYKYMKYIGVNRPIYLVLHYRESDYSSSVERMFVRRLTDISNGLGYYNNPEWVSTNLVLQWGYSPIDTWQTESKKCISLNLNKSNTEQCHYQVDYDFQGP